MKVAFTLFLLLTSLLNYGQTAGFVGHELACGKMQAEAEKALDKGLLPLARVIGKEALDEAQKCADANLITQSHLLLFRISNQQNDFYKSLESGLAAFSESETALSDYRLASILSLLSLFEQWDIMYLGLDYAEAGLGIASIDKNTKLFLLKSKAIALEKNDKWDLAITTWIELKNFARDNNNYNEQLEALQRLALIYQKRKEYPKAIEYFQEQNVVAGWYQFHLQKASSANNIAICKEESGELESAFYFYDEALDNCPKGSVQYTEMCLNRAYLEKRVGNKESMKRYVDMALKHSKKVKDARGEAKALVVNAAILKDEGNSTDALTEIQKSIEFCKWNSLEDIHLEALSFLIQFYAEANDREKESQFEQEKKDLSERIALKNKSLEQQHTNFALAVEQTKTSVQAVIAKNRELKLEMEKQGLDRDNREKSMTIMRTEQELAKSEFERTRVAKEKAQRELLLVQASLENQQSHNAIIELEGARSAQLLELTKLELDKEEETNKLKLSQQQNEVLASQAQVYDERSKREQIAKQMGIAIGILCFLCALGAVFIMLRVRKSNQQIASQNKELNIKNDDIEKSIISASYFQSSITPDATKLRQSVKDGFILYKPLDVVSGDLPFVNNIDGYTFIAAVDCIGHGVPAAMLSFTAYYNLNKIIESSSSKDLGDMLKELDVLIKESLKSKGEQVNFNAGMDISLVRIDHHAKAIHYAGAQSPLIVVDDQKCEYIKGARYSVADINSGFDPNYESRLIAMEEGSKYYLMSDGFIHQMRGDERQKLFSRKRLMELFKETYRLTFQEIETKLTQAHLDWKGNNQQTDDILIIGFEI